MTSPDTRCCECEEYTGIKLVGSERLEVCRKCDLPIKDIPAAVDSEEAAKKRGHYLNGDGVGRERKYDAPTAAGKSSSEQIIDHAVNALADNLELSSHKPLFQPPRPDKELPTNPSQISSGIVVAQPAPWEQELQNAAAPIGGKADPQYVVELPWVKSFIAKEIAAAEKRGRDAACDYIEEHFTLSNADAMIAVLRAARALHP